MPFYFGTTSCCGSSHKDSITARHLTCGALIDWQDWLSGVIFFYSCICELGQGLCNVKMRSFVYLGGRGKRHRLAVPRGLPQVMHRSVIRPSLPQRWLSRHDSVVGQYLYLGEINSVTNVQKCNTALMHRAVWGGETRQFKCTVSRVHGWHVPNNVIIRSHLNFSPLTIWSFYFPQTALWALRQSHEACNLSVGSQRAPASDRERSHLLCMS